MAEFLISTSPLETAKPSCPTPLSQPLGVIEEVHGSVIDILCNRLPSLHQALYFCLHSNRYTFEVHRHLDESRTRAIVLHRTSGLRGLPGDCYERA